MPEPVHSACESTFTYKKGTAADLQDEAIGEALPRPRSKQAIELTKIAFKTLSFEPLWVHRIAKVTKKHALLDFSIESTKQVEEGHSQKDSGPTHPSGCW